MKNIPNAIHAALGFSEEMGRRPKYHANDTQLDDLNLMPKKVEIADARNWDNQPQIDREGFQLINHRSSVKNFRDTEDTLKKFPGEVIALIKELTGADEVLVNAPPILRFGERSEDSGALENSRPARMVHIDVSDSTADSFYKRSRPANNREISRSAQYNIWRVLTPPPQDVPLALCDARSLSNEDLISAEAIFDQDGVVRFSFEGLLVKHNPKQRWIYFSDMCIDEALVFKTHDTDPNRAHHVPHGAFDNPYCPPETKPRASAEMRAMAFWYE